MALSRFKNITIKAIATAVPANCIEVRYKESNKFEFLYSKTKRLVRRSIIKQTTSDLGYVAAREIFNKYKIESEDIGFLLFVSLTPDYRSPATATVLHQRMNMPVDCIAFDINIGGTGFFHGLQTGCALLERINKSFGLVITGDTPSKQFAEDDLNYLLLGDRAAAILLEKNKDSNTILINTGSSGEHYTTFHIPEGGFRLGSGNGFGQERDFLWNMSRTIKPIPDFDAFYTRAISELSVFLTKFLHSSDIVPEYDLVLLPFLSRDNPMLNDISNLAGKEVFYAESQYIGGREYDSGNFIPLFLSELNLAEERRLRRILCAGVGEGISWGIADFCINDTGILNVIETDEFFKDGSVSHDL